MTTHVYTPHARVHAHFPSAFHPALSLSLSFLFLSLLPFHPSQFSLFHSSSLTYSLTPTACVRRRRISDVGEERYSRGENENAHRARARGVARTGVDGCSAHEESGVNMERGVTQERQRNAGIGEAVTMTTVTGEVLVRIRDHAYVTTP